MADRASLLLERRLRIGEDIERSWWFVRYLRGFPLVIEFEVYRTWFQMDNQPIGGVIAPAPAWTFQDPHHFPSRQPEAPFVRGSIKFDGNYEILPGGGMLYVSHEELASIGILLGRIYDQCAELLAVIDTDASCYPEAEKVRIDEEPCAKCGTPGQVCSTFGAVSMLSDEDGHMHNSRSSTSYRCRNGHGWTTGRIDPCPEEKCAHGKGLDEAIDRAKAHDKRNRR